MKVNDWKIEYRPGGWIRGRDQLGTTVFFRVDLVGQGDMSRPQVHIAVMDSHDPISARSWRDAPFKGVETHAQLPEIREILVRPAEVESVDSLNAYFDRTADAYRVRSHIVTDVRIASEGEPPANFRPVRAPGSRLTDEFLENVAAMYRWAVAAGKAPAPVIAKSAGVPASRVHRWVAQARLRGFLPPGIKGRTG